MAWLEQAAPTRSATAPGLFALGGFGGGRNGLACLSHLLGFALACTGLGSLLRGANALPGPTHLLKKDVNNAFIFLSYLTCF